MEDAQEICDRYGPLVWRSVYRILGNHADALDCCQDVLCEAWQKADQFQLHESSMRWLATRRAIDLLRKRKRSQNRLQIATDVKNVQGQEPGPLEEAEYNELLDQLRDCVSKLPDQQAEAFWMRCVDEMSYSDIAEQLRIDANKVGVLIHRAKNQLRTSLINFANPFVKSND